MKNYNIDGIAAASILAKVDRDKYIEEICDCYKKLNLYSGA